MRIRNSLAFAFAAAALGLAVAACGGAARSGTTDVTSSALSAAIASSTASSGTLLCAPAQGQIDACASKAAGDACTLTSTKPDGSTRDVAGTCRTTIDGTAVACAPNPPAPPEELVAACAAKSAGDACTVDEAFGDSRSGVCMAAGASGVLVCGRVRTPPPAAVDACASHVAGDACTVTLESRTITGVCSMGPASTGPLACAPRRDLLPHGVEACTGLAAGAACTMGRHGEGVTGTCVVPAGGDAAVCVVACRDLGGRFRCGSGHDDDGHEGPMGSAGPMGPGMGH
jgi:hypothetical protein